MNSTNIPYLEKGWNLCGFGCSKGYGGCWARAFAGRGLSSCPDCKAFRVHFHPERLEKGFTQKKPAVVGVQFTGDLFDPAQPVANICKVLDAAADSPQHTYVFLTQQYERAYEVLVEWTQDRAIRGKEWLEASYKWYVGTTCHNQIEYDIAARIFANTGWNWWVSAEPLELSFMPGFHAPKGIIVGSDNRSWHDCGINEIHETVEDFALEGVPVYVKQLCESGKVTTDLADFPEELRIRDLPWQPVEAN